MPDEPARPTGGGAARTNRFRPRHLDLAEDGVLRLHGDGAIDHLDAAGGVVGSWQPDDPEWPRYAIRFGVRPQELTVAPHGGPDGGMRPPRR